MAVNAASKSAFEIPRLARMSAAVPAGAVWILRRVVRRRGLASAFLADFFVVRFVRLLGILVPQSRTAVRLHSRSSSTTVKGTLAMGRAKVRSLFTSVHVDLAVEVSP